MARFDFNLYLQKKLLYGKMQNKSSIYELIRIQLYKNIETSVN